MKILAAEFLVSAMAPAQYPVSCCLRWRLLVGRMSANRRLSTRFCTRKGLAKTSATPGKTQAINFF